MNKQINTLTFILLLGWLCTYSVQAQYHVSLLPDQDRVDLNKLLIPKLSMQPAEAPIKLLEQAPRFHNKRFWTAAGVGVSLYAASMYSLNKMWYADYPRSRFHLFNDWGEWGNMDKVGHAFSAYNESLFFYNGARWTGMTDNQAIWTSVGIGTLIQSSIELLDGFSDKWGFSLSDVGFNTLGCGLFAAQEYAWGEQRIVMKVSSYRRPYSDMPILSNSGENTSSIQAHADHMFGTSLPAIFLKDYNAQTIWLSANIASFMPRKDNNIPKWLNVAVGYGVQNIFGGYHNQWSENGETYSLNKATYPRYRQMYLSLDIDLTRIRTKNRFLKTFFSVFNMIKIPAPAIEFNTLGELKLHPLHF